MDAQIKEHKAHKSIQKLLRMVMLLIWGFTSLFPTQLVRAEAPGRDGGLTVTTANTILNQYAKLTANVAAGNTSISIVAGATNGLNPATLQPGDLLLIIQMQGASIDTTTNAAPYGNVTSLNNAGNQEFITVGSVVGNTVNLASYCTGGLKNSYTATGNVQVIRVPQYSTLTVSAGASITAPPWDGSTGGVVAIHAQNSVLLNGSVDVSGKGFRGGFGAKVAVNFGQTSYRSATDTVGAEKGEGIAGAAASLPNGRRYGRGAPANGGGGGDNHNAAGGGGANGNNGNSWTGQGVMDSNPAFLNAWKLDPGYIANGNARTNSSGGGRGGYTYSSNDVDATTNPPGDTAWGGDNRREVGGLGGHPLTNDPASRLFMGGGGGAGDSNDAPLGGSSGGNGGGLVYLIANQVSGGGSILANGAQGQDIGDLISNSGGNDGPGGAGAGGTVIVKANALGGIGIQANGGRGGNQYINTNEAEGTGGGGGGGYIATAGGVVTASAAGGLNGTSPSPAVTEFFPNGGTQGASGQANGTVANILYCYAPIGVTKQAGRVINNSNGTYTVPYTVTVQNLSSAALTNVQVTDNLVTTFPLPATINGVSTPVVTVTTLGFGIPATTLSANNGFNGSTNQNLLLGGGVLAAGSVGTISFNVTVNPGSSISTYSNTATGSGTGPNGTLTDTSDSGTNPDPNGNTNPNEAGENDPTPTTFTRLTLVKRVTGNKHKGAATVTPITGFNDLLPPDPKAGDDNLIRWPNATYLQGTFDGSQVSAVDRPIPGDEVEYTIYFLSDGGNDVANTRLCDFIPANSTYVPGTLQLVIGTNPAVSITDGTTDTDGGYYTAGFPAACNGTNNGQGAVFANIGTVNKATAPGTPNTSYGFIRFRARVN